ncbi:MAG: fold metallo-hydrolase [Massilia sp.]|nr:fold metallo-hydrolase [Massilia sp.]
MSFMHRIIYLVLLLLAPWTHAAAPEPPPREARRLELPAGGAIDTRASIQFIGTATVLLRFGGITILTDPNFLHKGEKVHLGYGLTSTRLTNPAIDFEQLPPIDLVLLSHLHEDHFDRKVRQQLRRDVPIVTNLRAAAHLKDAGFINAIGLRTWQKIDIVKGATTIALTSLPARHGPAGVAALLPDVMGSMLDLRDAGRNYRIYVSGDTMISDDVTTIPQRYPGVDLAVLHLGGTRLLGLVTVTMDGAEGVRMLQLMAPQHAIPVHYDDYDVFKSPLADFKKAVDAAGLSGKVSYLARGDTYDLPIKTKEANSEKP